LQQEGGRSTGTVKWFSSEKGWGFITRDDGDELFVHYKEIVGEGFRTLAQGQQVEFDITQTDKGLQASRVTVLG
jgi:CspA family cold shock protein